MMAVVKPVPGEAPVVIANPSARGSATTPSHTCQKISSPIVKEALPFISVVHSELRLDLFLRDSHRKIIESGNKSEYFLVVHFFCDISRSGLKKTQ